MKFNKKALCIMYFLIGTIFLQSTTAFAKTTRETTVRVKNMTGKEIESVSVVHKYSNVFKEEKDWNGLLDGRTTTRPMKVKYNTGIGTPGQDWWFITWKYKGDVTVFYTAPNNFRSIIDKVEGLISSATSSIPIVSSIAGALFNTESTVGFKKHLLRGSDQPGGLLITVKQDTVEFKSESGDSSTEGIQSKKVEIESTETPQTAAPAPIKANQCEKSIQGKIAWNYQGTKAWNPNNIKLLCGGVKTAEPATCFNRVMHSGINWGGGTKWRYQNVMNLCKKSQNSRNTVKCFQAVIAVHKGDWKHSINSCRAR